MINPRRIYLRQLVVCFSLANCSLIPTIAGGQASEDPLTVAEASNYKATSKSLEVEQFIEKCVAAGEHVTSTKFGETVDGKPMTAAIVATPAYDPNEPDGRVVALLLGNIHSGECAGKEALLMMLRDLTHQPDHRWLERVVFVFVPNYNADGNDRIELGNRPGQVGPEAGMGERPNSQGFDLNRDFMKLESPEARALVGLMNIYQPHLFVDCHTTNGSRHRYTLTFDIPHNPFAPESIVTYQRDKMIPAVVEQAKENGHDMFYYGNFSGAFRRRGDDAAANKPTQWRTYGAEPRYSTEYGGLRGCLSVLSEAYAYISYRERIEATDVFVTACVDYLYENNEEIKRLLDRAEEDYLLEEDGKEEATRSLQLPLAYEQAAFDEPVTILGYDGEEPADLEVEFFGKYVPTRERKVPYAYVFSSEWKAIAERLMDHGIVVEQLSEAVSSVSMKELQCESVTAARRPFQGHQMKSVQGKSREAEGDLPVGTYVVQTKQPLGRIATYLLDPESNDGLTTWNFFDSVLAVGETHPVRWIEKAVELPLQQANQAKDGN